MMITAKTTEFDKVSGLDLGADDYITKPFGMAELVARVKALLRRSGMKTSAERLTHEELIVEIAKHTVTVGGHNIILTYKEFSLLACLMENAGRAYTREQLLETVWGYDYEGGTRTVDVHVQTLRTKLGSAGRFIETVRGVGYRFGE
jgi:two-component system alkaline phosphatase synthesis response regulator PhoP